MSTILQKTLAQEIVKNASRKIKKNKKELLVSSGYAIKSADSVPAKIIDQKGVQEELRNLGFTQEGAQGVVEEIMYNKKVNATARLQATRQVFEVTGAFAPEKHLNINTTAEELKELIQNDLSKFRSQ